jgi:hypothetical protein
MCVPPFQDTSSICASFREKQKLYKKKRERESWNYVGLFVGEK